MKRDFSRLTQIAQAGDLILFYNNRNILSKKIGEFHNLDIPKDIHYSHVAIYLGSGQGLIFESAFPSGTQIVPISKYFLDKYTITVKRLDGITVDTVSELKDVIYQKIALKQKYAVKSFLGFLTAKIFNISSEKNNIFNNNNEEFCSSILDDVWKDIGYDFFPNIGDKRVTPNDWAALPQFTLKITV